MRCIFCKQDSSASKSIEHIIPESLGNTTSVLPKGVVCDKCNNYFARKVEQPFLESTEIKSLRFREAIPNKKGFVPPINGILNQEIPVKVYNPLPGVPLFSCGGDMIFAIDSEYYDALKNIQTGNIYAPAFVDEMIPESSAIISRFVAKIALESLAERFYKHEGGLDYLIDDSAFDPIRHYARVGGKAVWPYHIRRIYNMDKQWADNAGAFYQVVHESDFLVIPADEHVDLCNDNPVLVYPYFVLALFGLEFVINIGDSGADSLSIYQSWLKEHDNISPLYNEKNRGVDMSAKN